MNNVDEFSRALIQSANENKSRPSSSELVNLEKPFDDEQVGPIELLEYAVNVPEFVARQDERRKVVVSDEFMSLGANELLKHLRAWFSARLIRRIFS